MIRIGSVEYAESNAMLDEPLRLRASKSEKPSIPVDHLRPSFERFFRRRLSVITEKLRVSVQELTERLVALVWV